MLRLVLNFLDFFFSNDIELKSFYGTSVAMRIKYHERDIGCDPTKVHMEGTACGVPSFCFCYSPLSLMKRQFFSSLKNGCSFHHCEL